MLLRSLALVLLGLTLAACGEREAQELQLEITPVALFPDDPGRRNIGALSYAGGIEIASPARAFGGWSAIEVSPDGERLKAGGPVAETHGSQSSISTSTASPS